MWSRSSLIAQQINLKSFSDPTQQFPLLGIPQSLKKDGLYRTSISQSLLPKSCPRMTIIFQNRITLVEVFSCWQNKGEIILFLIFKYKGLEIFE